MGDRLGIPSVGGLHFYVDLICSIIRDELHFIDMTRVFRSVFSVKQINTGGNLTLPICILFVEKGAAKPYF